MKKHRAIARTDGNHSEIARAFVLMGASWQDVHTIPGALDGIIGYRGIDIRIEVKDPVQPLNKRKLTKAEKETFRDWRGRPPEVIETLDDVENLIFRLNKEINVSRKASERGNICSTTA